MMLGWGKESRQLAMYFYAALSSISLRMLQGLFLNSFRRMAWVFQVLRLRCRPLRPPQVTTIKHHKLSMRSSIKPTLQELASTWQSIFSVTTQMNQATKALSTWWAKFQGYSRGKQACCKRLKLKKQRTSISSLYSMPSQRRSSSASKSSSIKFVTWASPRSNETAKFYFAFCRRSTKNTSTFCPSATKET